MSSRTSERLLALAIALLAPACSEPAPADREVLARAEQQQGVAAVEEGRVNCALAGARALARTCTVDREQGARGLVLTIRHPDGGFRRLLVTRDGRGVVAADGAEPARVSIVDAGEIEVAIGDDVYRLPATVAPRVAAR